MTVEIIIPWRGGCPHRHAAWERLRARYRRPVTVATAPTGPWVKALALMPAIAASRAQVVVIADADVWCDELELAIRAVELGAPWAIPHHQVHRLTRDATAEVIAGARWEDQPVEQKPYGGVEGGGIIVTRRETLLEIPLDPRFTGWGQEDESHAIALRALLGEPWRGTAPLVHLWHPPQERMTRRRGSPESWRLRRRYLQARGDPAAMRALIQEANDALDAPEHADHDRQPHRR